MSGRRGLGLALVLATSAAAAGCAWLADRSESTIRVSLACNGSRCTASIDGGEPLDFRLPYRAGHGIGVYAYHPYEFDGSQAFRSLRLHPGDSPDTEVQLRFFDGAWTPAGWTGTPGWSMSDRGFAHEGRPGARAVALFPGVEARDFRLEAELVDTVDAGVVFRAADARSGWVLTVRPRHNDAFVFPLENGEPGKIVAMMPVRPLSVGRETLRLAGLVGSILLVIVPLLLLARAWLVVFPATRATDERRAPDATHAPWPWLVGLGVLTVAALATIGVFALDGIPHIDDEAAYLFQAKIFAGGDFWAPAPPEPEFFRHEHVIVHNGRWFGKYPPLFPWILSLGVRAGVPWLVNPILGALVGFATYLLGREIAGWRFGLVAWCLLLVSPFFLIMGGTLMSHIAAALFVTLFVWLALRALGTGGTRPAVLAGVCLGLATLTRPYTALLAGIAAGCYGLASLARAPDRRALVRVGLVLAVTALPFAWAFTAWGPWVAGQTDGHVGLHTLYNASDTLGFGPDKGATWLRTWGTFGHTPAKAVRSAWNHLEYTSRYLFGWPGRLSLALVLAPFVLGAAGRRESLLLGVLGALAVGHMYYWAAHHILYGARYWFEAVPCLMVLAALGLRALVGEGARGDNPPSWARLAPRLALAALVAFCAWVYLPPRLRQLPDYGGISAELERQIDRLAPQRAVVFSKTQGLQYDPGFFLNDPYLRSDRVFARDLGSHNDDLLMRYPGYLAYRWADGRLTPIAGAGTHR